MGLTKQYSNYEPSGIFNVIASGRSNCNFVTFNKLIGRYVAVGAAENVYIWDMRLKQKVLELIQSKSYNRGHNQPQQEVTSIRPCPDKVHIAIGFTNGNVEIYNLVNKELISILALHRSAINVLCYDRNGLKLISGGLDTDIIVSDCIAGCGQYRLSGHTAPITDACFYEKFSDNIIISSSKDSHIKFWNVDAQYCFKTIVMDHRTDVWGVALMRNFDFLVTGSNQNVLNVFKITESVSSSTPRSGGTLSAATSLSSINDDDENRDIINKVDEGDLNADDDDDDDDKNNNNNNNNIAENDFGIEQLCPINCTLVGTLQRRSKGRTVSLVTESTGQIVACHGTDDRIELFQFYNKSIVRKRVAKRMKKLSKSAAHATTDPDADDDDDNGEDNDNHNDSKTTLFDQIRRLNDIKTNFKIKSIDMELGGPDNTEIRICALLANNTMVIYALNFSADGKKLTNDSDVASQLTDLNNLGHLSEVRSLCFTSDGLAIASASGESLKLWNRDSLKNIRTVYNVGYVLCCAFAPGDRYILLGLKTGKLLIVNILSGDIIEDIDAHTNELWSMCLLPDLSGVVTGSSDQTLKLWTFQLIDVMVDEIDEHQEQKIQNGIKPSKQLSLLHKNTLKLEEPILCCKISNDSKFLAVGLMDQTAKIFFLDTFKFYLSLYGHKLPVLCLDISDDSKLVVTGSSDRNCKIWGLNFGDCHRSLFAHDDSVMAIKFIPKTHLFWTCGKDGKIKQWDGDSFQKILTIGYGHLGEAYNLTVSGCGHYLVTCGSDRTIRLFNRTQEPLVLEDVQQDEREQMENRMLATGTETMLPVATGLTTIKLPSRKTVGAENGAEAIIECIAASQLYDADATKKNELPTIMQAYSMTNTLDFLLFTFKNIRASDLEESLVLLTFENVCYILEKIPLLLQSNNEHLELIARVAIFLFRLHQRSIIAHRALLPVIRNVIATVQERITEYRELIGTNLHSMQYVQRDIEAHDDVELFADATKKKKLNDKKKKRRETAKRANIQLI